MLSQRYFSSLNIPLRNVTTRILRSIGYKSIDTNEDGVFQPLDKTRNEIRTLSVQPSLDAEQILVCNLKIVRLGSNTGTTDSWHNYFFSEPVYEALSYTWGDDPACVEILLNGQIWMVRPNLNDALRQLRRPSEALNIFVDALCIDQNNLDEKNWQVRLMSRIYRQASVVHCWLGQANKTSERAFEICRLATNGYIRSSSTGDQRPDVSLADLRALSDMLNRPYWQRAWILQESTLANRAIFHCGAYFISKHEMPSISQITSFTGLIFDLFERFRKDIHENGSEDVTATTFQNETDLSQFLQNLYKRIGSSYSAFAGIKANVQSGHPLPALYLAMAATQLAQDQRDHVYAFLGLLEEEMSTQIVPAYAEPIAFAFQQLAFAWLAVRRNVELFSFAIGTRENPYSLPSWVPDFSAIDLTNTGFIGQFYEHNTQITPEVVAMDHGRRLGIKAHAFDTIAEILLMTIEQMEFPVSSERMDKATTYHKLWRSFFGLHPTSTQEDIAEYIGGDSLENAYWRTLTAQIAGADACFLLNHQITALKSWLVDGFEQLSPADQHSVTQYTYMLTKSNGRYLFKTAKGYYGRTDNSGSPIVERDKTFFLASGAQPFVCRQRQDGEGLEGDEVYTLVDGTYIHGLMKVDREKLTTEGEQLAYGMRILDPHPQVEAASGSWERIWLA